VVGVSIDKLQCTLLDDRDDYLRSIAEFRLNGATNRPSVGPIVTPAYRFILAANLDPTLLGYGVADVAVYLRATSVPRSPAQR